MALNIPMPDLPGNAFLKGLDTGSTAFSRMIQPGLEQARQKQAEQDFQQRLQLEKTQAAHAAANDDLRRMILQQQLISFQHRNDPNYEINQMKNMLGSLGNTGNSSNGKPDFSTLKNNPLIRAMFKSKFGIDLAQETPEEKENRELDLAQKKSDLQENTRKNVFTQNQNTKQAQKLEDTADSLMDYAYNNEKISNILDRNPNATGNLPAFRNFLNLGGEDAGEFNNLAIPMQGQLARNLSSRGGAVVAKLAGGAKYNLSKNHDYNTGIRKSTTNDIINTYDTLNDRYKRLTGNDLPQKLSPFYDNWRKQKNGTQVSSQNITKGRLKYNPSTGRLE